MYVYVYNEDISKSSLTPLGTTCRFWICPDSIETFGIVSRSTAVSTRYVLHERCQQCNRHWGTPCKGVLQRSPSSQDLPSKKPSLGSKKTPTVNSDGGLYAYVY